MEELNVPEFILKVRFYQTVKGNEPVREWLRSLSPDYKKIIGEEIKTVQYGWPLGMPLVRKLDRGLWEIRIQVKREIVRVIFTLCEGEMILLHGFIKKSQKIPQEDLKTAVQRKKDIGKKL